MKRIQKDICLGHLMPQVIRTRLGKRYWNFYLLSSAWHEIVGEHIAARVSPAWIRQKTLWLYVSAPAWSQEIQLIKPELLEKIRKYLPDAKIEDLRCLQKPIEASTTKPRGMRPEPALDGEANKEHIVNLTKSLPDARAGKALYTFWKKVHGIDE